MTYSEFLTLRPGDRVDYSDAWRAYNVGTVMPNRTGYPDVVVVVFDGEDSDRWFVSDPTATQLDYRKLKRLTSGPARPSGGTPRWKWRGK